MTGAEKVGAAQAMGGLRRPGAVWLGGSWASAALQLGDPVLEPETKPFECLHLGLTSGTPAIVNQAVQAPMFLLQAIKVAIHGQPPWAKRSTRTRDHSN